MKESWTTTSPQETRDLAQEVLQRILPTGVLLLEGDLGAGKTCFVQGLADAMGLDAHVTSPTYGFVKEYGDPPQLIHADLYRLGEGEELGEIGLEDWLDQPVLCAIEWPDRISWVWPPETWKLIISADPVQESVRNILLCHEEPE